ncbi:MAG: hypothetical protein CMJ76_07675 [Planctomycetaceae bacterium]|nr:hypothetical protein [Planctomycetaceae bacterium]|tara:strand:- start:4393 stop:5334 length:942 start_codon:yes stop_codon:yes gene_type:complete
MMRKSITKIALLIGLIIASHTNAAGPHYSVIRTDDYLMVKQKEIPVIRYRISPRSKDGQYTRNNYVDLFNLQGYEITEDFPEDHLHHRGVFWAWHQVIVGEKHLGDSWECRDFTWDSKQVTTAKIKGAVLLETRTNWSSPDYVDDQGIEIPVVLEETNVYVHKTKNGARVIDFHITINPLVDQLKLGGSQNDKGYGGFSPRIRLPADIKFWSAEGQITPQRTAIEAGPWINMEGTFDKNNNARSTIAIICHRSNPVYPDKWILRARGSMQNAAYPGQSPVNVPKTKPLELRYRLVIQNNGHNPQRIDRLSKQF